MRNILFYISFASFSNFYCCRCADEEIARIGFASFSNFYCCRSGSEFVQICGFASFSNFYCCRLFMNRSSIYVLQASLISTVVDMIKRMNRACFAIFSNFYCCRYTVLGTRELVLQASLISTVVDNPIFPHRRKFCNLL